MFGLFSKETVKREIKYDVRRTTSIVTMEIGFVSGESKTVSYCLKDSDLRNGDLYDFNGDLVLRASPSNITYQELIEETEAAYIATETEWYEMGDAFERIDELEESDNVLRVGFTGGRMKIYQ